jgi:predicted RNase H-like nuclease
MVKSDPERVYAHRRQKRVMLEVYPHPALLELFGLRRIIRYKKGKAASRRNGQGDLQRRLCELPRFKPPLACTTSLSGFLATDTKLLRGADLKANEDKLDAIVCAYIAYYHWLYRWSRSRLFGDVHSGYIVVPTLSTLSAHRQAFQEPL